MVEQYTENQYDDDLTDGSGEYDDSYYTGADDLFDYTPDEESPISRLKSLVLSIDWEITDDVLLEFNEELLDLRDIWAGEKINLVYVQALEKLSKYIYQKKAESHPSAIKLLLTLYHNLEKIITSESLSENEKKEILLEDVKRFENLKAHLKTSTTDKTEVKLKPVAQEAVVTEKRGAESELLNLKAIVLGIDWEITDEDLSALRREVIRLEKLFAGSRPKLILLQGIGTIGAYIKLKKSDSHADAFKVLHLFYGSLEKIVDTAMSIEQEKAVLFPAVEKFNEFKTLLGETISPESISRSEGNREEEGEGRLSSTVTPAFSDLPEDEVLGFQADKEAAALGIDNPDKVNVHVANFFGEDSFLDEREPAQQLTTTLESQFAETSLSEPEKVDKNIALQGVDVEEGDEDEDDTVAPALSFEEDYNDDSPVAQDTESSDDTVSQGAIDAGPGVDDIPIEITFPDEGEDTIVADFSSIDKSIALQGVDVESEADDDSDEDALPLLEGVLAPALADNDEVSVYNAETLEAITVEEGLDDEVAGTVLDFFEEEDDVAVGSVGAEDLGGNEPLKLDEDVIAEPESEIIVRLSDAVEDESNEDVPAHYANVESDGPVASTFLVEDQQNEDFSSDIEGQLDDFFGSEEVESNDSSNDIFTSMGFADDTSQPSIEVIEDINEEEVIFELVDDTIISDNVIETSCVAAAAATALDGTIDEISEAVDSDNLLDSLATCIEATGLELEDKILGGLLTEIDAIEQKWNNKPLEKTFLHLLRTIGRHIDRYRYEAGSTAYELLKSVFDTLLLSQTDVDRKQELLLSQTIRVLDWQQSVIADDSAKSVDSSSEPLFVQELGNSGDDMLTFEDELFGDVDLDNEADLKDSGNGTHVSGNLKDEISNLRKSLQDEISVLKKEKTDE